MRIFIYSLECISIVFACGKAAAQDLLPYVNPLTGTAASVTASAHAMGTEQYANTIPAVGLPFGMTQWTPQTRPTEKKCQPPYYYRDSLFSGFRGTHWLSGSCTQDYGSLTVMPVSGKLQTEITSYQCAFDHDGEIATPYYYRVALPRYHITAEMTATARCGIMRFTAHESDSLYLLAVPNSDRGEGYVKVDPVHHEIRGYNPAHRLYQGWGEPAGFSGYFVIRFRQNFSSGGVFSGARMSDSDSLENKKDAGAYAGFFVPRGNTLLVKVGTSFSSIEEARKNLQAEIPGWDFNSVKKECRSRMGEGAGADTCGRRNRAG